MEFELGERVVAVRCGLMTRKSKMWHAKRAAIEEPYALRYNICRSLATADSFEHVLSRIQRAFVYLAVPQLRPKGQRNGLRWQPDAAYCKLRLRRIANKVEEVDVFLDSLRYFWNNFQLQFLSLL